MKHSFFLIQLILAQAALAQTAPPANKASMLSNGAQSRTLRAPIGIQGAAPAAFTSSSSGGFIEAVLNTNGQFTIGTVAGDPAKTSDDNKPLLFGHPNPGTSDTMIKVDGVSSSIHGGASS